MLNRGQTCFLEILQAAMQGKKYDLCADDAEMLRQILHMASIQHVLPMICEAIYEADSVRKYEALFSTYKKQAANQVVSQVVRSAQFLDLYQYLVRNGLSPVIVKGLSIRRLYPRENLRTSVDEDILIHPEEIQQYHEMLIAYGMQQMEPEQNIIEEPEISYIDPQSHLYIEVHKYLMPPGSKAYGELNRYFENIQTITMEHNGQRLKTLSPTDHVFFLICHSFKHFLHSGFGIRQICDLVIFSDVYAEEIRWDKIWLQCQEIHTDGFVKAIYQIGNKYLLSDNRYSVHLEKWHIEDAKEEPMLLDVLASGVHGASEMTRLHSSNITLNAVANQKNNKYTKGTVRSSIFLPLENMRGRYRYLDKAPFLLPIAWMQRLFHYVGELANWKSTGNNAADSIKLGKQRVELLKFYGILGETHTPAD